MFARLLAAWMIFGLCSASNAADLSMRNAPTPAPFTLPVFTWTGAYLGGHIGYAWARDSYASPSFANGLNLSPEGILGGAEVGYNYQVQHVVFGIEGDVDGTGASRSAYDPVTGASVSTAVPVEGSVRGRIGLAVDQALIYATGGLALAHENTRFSAPGFSASRGLAGWTVGGGIQYAFTDHWSMRGEYRFAEFEHSVDTTAAGTAVTHQQIQHAVRVGVDYKFEMYAPPPPLVAKY
jgi:outer membrane immunogenic protein